MAPQHSNLSPPELLSLCTNLVSSFKARPVRRLKTGPLQALRRLCIRLFREIVELDDVTPSVVAFLGLPRLVQAHLWHPSQLQSFLDGAGNSVPTWAPVLEAIASWNPPAQAPFARTEAAPSGLPVRRITELVQSNNIGLALQTLESAHQHIRPSDPAAAREAISALFPPRSDGDLLGADLASGDALQLTVAETAEALRTLPRLRASSYTGWTADIFTAMARDSPEFVSAFTNLINAMLRGEAGPAALWSLDYICPLEKKTGGYRPIVIGEIVPRILGRIVAKSLAPQAAEFLSPLQWGVGISGGAEIVAHLVSLYYKGAHTPGVTDGIQLIDFTNAFNTVHRSSIERALQQRFPSLLRYFRYAYGQPTVLRGADGQPMATSASGVRQGDPLGPLFFCLALDAPLRSLASRFPDVTAVGLLDDVTLLGPADRLPQALSWFREATARIGLTVNTRKSVRLKMPHDDVSEDAAIGARVLGCPVGPDAWVTDQVRSRLEEYATIIDPLVTLPAHIATAILQAAVNARPVFTARTTLPALASEAFIAFDNKIDYALSCITGTFRTPLPRESQLLRGLPQAKGGLAIPRIAEIASSAYAASLTAATSAVATVLPATVNHFHLRSTAISPVMEAARDVAPTHYVPSVVYPSAATNHPCIPCSWAAPGDLPTDEDAPYRQAPPRQKTLVALRTSAHEAELETILATSPAAKAIVLSGAHRGGAWWLSQPRFPTLRLSHAAMQSALCVRLLLTSTSITGARRCGFCSHVLRTSGEELVHGLSCSALQGLRTRRHTYLRDTLAELLRKVLGNQAVALEVRFADRQLDICATVGPMTRYLDLTIINPAAQEYLPGAAQEGGAASLRAEANKRAKYVNTLAAHGIGEAAFVPFVIETTGRLGPAAKRFLDDLRTAAVLASPERDREAIMDYYIDRMKHHVLEANAKVMHHAWAHLEPVQDEIPADTVTALPQEPPSTHA